MHEFEWTAVMRMGSISLDPLIERGPRPCDRTARLSERQLRSNLCLRGL
jgi:hypothetical protein